MKFLKKIWDIFFKTPTHCSACRCALNGKMYCHAGLPFANGFCSPCFTALCRKK